MSNLRSAAWDPDTTYHLDGVEFEIIIGDEPETGVEVPFYVGEEPQPKPPKRKR